ncbi:hypothetical protein [Gimesia sp.]|uniref:hypothetical protein n=1 Tax=Gimesia sp. TaxID=2024833 RepID=UPI000C45DA1B|nr:hypothetical protein [Gimesia sp.]MAX40682.1 hypothetical protein [Gimesia sp.]HAH48447.1 hypothetical protein [Planctomycetaceae bacterium]HBL45470.1 hypothetical protein [Planctomycetaceae bacterium]|tara:strand:- start:164 stop:559 length:396 start_codon:yes stop_codon:yes gene_type:complete
MSEFGLIAYGRSGNWELMVDKLLEEPETLGLQIESSLIALQLEISNLNLLKDWQNYWNNIESEGRVENRSFQIGRLEKLPVIINYDTEYSDRLFIVVNETANGRLGVTVAGEDYHQLRNALLEAISDLEAS